MAMEVIVNGLGIDVAKDWLDIANGKDVIRVDNNKRAIQSYLTTLHSALDIAVEPTNRYHELFIQLAIEAGHSVYLVDAYRVSKYREAMGVRAKTDTSDANLLYRYLCAEIAHLTPYKPASKAVKRMMSLLKARAKLSQSRSTMNQYLSNIGELACTRKALLNRIDQAIELIDNKLEKALVLAGYSDDYQRCQSIPGVGPVNAAALVALYHRGEFKKADSFIAFMGLDVRVRDSGKYRGQRKLTKKGNSEMRRLLFNAARSGTRTKKWKETYQSLRERGFSTTAACVAISRKIARLAFALLRDQSTYRDSVIN